MSDQSELTWHLAEKVILGVGGGLVLLLATIARPWISKQIMKLHRENAADFREFIHDIAQENFARLDNAADNAEEAIRQMEQIRERVERLESATEEIGNAVAGLRSIGESIGRVETSLQTCVSEIATVRVELARVDERGKHGR
jgi:methyl-accepting chemotaxis protein